jgi:hypothetical protein
MEESMKAVYTTFNGVEDERLGQTRRNFSVDELRNDLGKVGLDDVEEESRDADVVESCTCA